MGDMSLEMIHKNLTDWLDDIVTGVKASQRQIQCSPFDDRAVASIGDDNPVLLHGFADDNPVLLHGFADVVAVLQPEVHYCVRQFWVDYHNEKNYKDTPKYAKFFNYDGVGFFTYVWSEMEIENACKQGNDSETLENLPVLDF